MIYKYDETKNKRNKENEMYTNDWSKITLMRRKSLLKL